MPYWRPRCWLLFLDIGRSGAAVMNEGVKRGGHMCSMSQSCSADGQGAKCSYPPYLTITNVLHHRWLCQACTWAVDTFMLHAPSETATHGSSPRLRCHLFFPSLWAGSQMSHGFVPEPSSPSAWSGWPDVPLNILPTRIITLHLHLTLIPRGLVVL